MFDPPPPNSPPEPIPIYCLGGNKKPGPGQYNVRKNFGSDKPTINMHVKHKVYEDVNQAPYINPDSTVGKGPKYTLKGRTEIAGDVTPGPEYVPPEIIEGLTPVLIKNRHAELTQDDVPAPGTYDPSKPFGSPEKGSSLHGTTNRSPYDINKDSPGPGNYENSNSRNGPAYTIGSHLNPLSQDDVPAPGTYDPTKPFGSQDRGVSLHGTTNRSPYDINKDSPGPGNYENSNSRDGPAYTIGSHLNPLSQDDVPAPGTYDPTKPFGSQDRGVSLHGTTNRSPYDINKDSPGPANYDRTHGNVRDGPSYTIGSHLNPLSQDDVPAPGTYDPTKPFGSQDRGVSLHGTTNRSPYDINKDSPGPANYDRTHGNVRDGPSYTIGSHLNPLSQDDVPAPGTYDPTKPFGSQDRGVSLHGTTNRSPYDINKDSPGPGNYENSNSRDGPAYTIGSHLNPLSQDDVPAPGTYDPTKPFGSQDRGVSLHGTTNRSPYDINKDSPGPANYDRTHGNVRDGPSYTIGNVHNPLSQDDVPAPGTYSDQDPRRFKNNPDRGLIHERVNTSDPAKGIPGPGTYSSERSPIRDTPPIKMKGRYSPKEEVNDVPYRDTRLPFSESPKYSIGNRPSSRNARSNGPEYSPPPFGHNGRKSTIASRKMKNYDNDTPAPGQYNPNRSFGSDARTISIGGKSESYRYMRSSYTGGRSSSGRLSSFSNSPGPGEYSPRREIGSGSPKYTIGGRISQRSEERGADYRNLGSTLGGPKWSLRSRYETPITYT